MKELTCIGCPRGCILHLSGELLGQIEFSLNPEDALLDGLASDRIIPTGQVNYSFWHVLTPSHRLCCSPATYNHDINPAKEAKCGP